MLTFEALPRASLWRAAAAAALLLVAGRARAELEPLRVVPRRDVTLTASAAVLALMLSSSYAAPGRCRMCGSGRLDDYARNRLRWGDPEAARLTSDIVVNGVLPAAVLLNSAIFAREGGDPGAFWEDALVLSEVAALTSGLDAATKDGTARRRPYAPEAGRGSQNRSFFSGHTSLAFALATGAGTVSTLRGYPSAPWVWAGGMTLAAGVGYLRIAGDAHWATDVIAGAGIGGLIGFTVPWFLHRVRGAGSGVDIVPTPGGVGVVF